MGFIRKTIKVKARKTRTINALIDTGADENYISSSLLKKIGRYRSDESVEFEVGDERTIKSWYAYFSIVMDSKEFPTRGIIIPSKRDKLIIGVIFLQTNNIKIGKGDRLITPDIPVLKVHRL